MTSMATTAVFVTGGVDTHGHTHHAAVLDYMGRQLGDREFPTSPAGYRALLQWMRGHGAIDPFHSRRCSPYAGWLRSISSPWKIRRSSLTAAGSS
jgi:hypothetical protein